MKERAARLSALRREMNIFGMDGFIVPRSDEHQGEYVAPCSERLAWLTGFTGSAGFAIVLAKKAAIFIDGRYTLQVSQEVDEAAFDYRHVADEPASEWLAGELGAGMKLAYDPWLHTGPSLHRLKKACEKVGAKLVAAPHNFIDAIWADRPEPPLNPIYPHSLDYAGQSHGEKLSDIADKLRSEGQDAMVLSLPDSIAWLFNIRGSDIPCTPVGLGFALVHSQGTACLFMDHRKVGEEVRTHLGDNIKTYDPQDLAEHLDRLKGHKVRLDGTSAPKWIHEHLKKAKAEVVLGDDLTVLPKACKNAVEVDGMRNAHRRDGAAMVRFLYWLSKQPFSKGVHEMAVSQKVDSIRSEDELFYDLSFNTISGAGENGAIVHYRVSEESSIPLPENGLYLVDSGAQYRDGTTDITRTIVRGTPTDEMKDRYTRVLKGHIGVSATRFPKGTTGSQLDVLARHALWQAGLDYDHGTGHGVGSFLNVHEGPQRISKMPSKTALLGGMVISNEPGYYKAGEYGIRLENLICVQPSQKGEREMLEFEPLTLCPFDLKGVEASLLSSAEVNWLNAYHARVREELSPMLGEDEAAWLAEATQAI
ncbi:Peptidase M24 [Candidatus Terasakiella magnetica]|uniref:Peptidase M24 n=1 Tax=Candidatus Terasakiella magnetica TaxID=1867952 RepID=A0A1C3RGT8_9PROT|nr:aminopeptidase P family protein [Candidatus Terasakiella magnetica]SCA56513.1 Peptidase M24 [Candidatus Terasakiella magnetica]